MKVYSLLIIEKSPILESVAVVCSSKNVFVQTHCIKARVIHDAANVSLFLLSNTVDLSDISAADSLFRGWHLGAMTTGAPVEV